MNPLALLQILNFIRVWWKPISVTAVALTIVLGLISYGEHRVQIKWDAANAVAAAAKEKADGVDAEARAALVKQHMEDLNYAKSEAGKQAIRDYLRTHRLYNTCGSTPQVPQGADGTTSQRGDATALEQFAGRCRADAQKVRLCTQWAIREQLEVE